MENYKIYVDCTNCGARNSAEIKKGKRVDAEEIICGYCGCKFRGNYLQTRIVPYNSDKRE